MIRRHIPTIGWIIAANAFFWFNAWTQSLMPFSAWYKFPAYMTLTFAAIGCWMMAAASAFGSSKGRP